LDKHKLNSKFNPLANKLTLQKGVEGLNFANGKKEELAKYLDRKKKEVLAICLCQLKGFKICNL